MVHSRNKGAAYERIIRKYMSERLDREVVNPAASGFSGADAVVSGFALECKNVARPLLAEWWGQAKSQTRAGELPVIVHKRHGIAAPGEQWVTMNLETLVDLIERMESVGGGES